MRIDSRFSTEHQQERILTDLTAHITTGYDLAFFFVSGFSQEFTKEITQKLRRTLSIKYLLACTASGVISSEFELEQQKACSVILIQASGVNIHPFYMNQHQMQDLKAPSNWYEFLNIYPTEKPVFFVLPDPFQLDINDFLNGMNQAFPHCPILGGLASAGAQSNQNTLILNDQAYDEGLIGVYLTGNIEVDTIVSQGCRPIGENYIVTKSQANIIYELAGKSLYDVLIETLEKATSRDRQLAQEAIFVGIAMDEYKHEFKRGDFLIRMLMGIDETSGAGAIADYIKVGQTVQFHVRDSVSSTEDLNELLSQQSVKPMRPTPAQGALVFSCNGRGSNLFNEKDHDIGIIKKHLGPMPMAGFFCAGELGPVGGRNFIHGFTSSIALFYPKG